MFKFILGAVFVVGLVGYGVIDSTDITSAGDRLVKGVNTVAKELDAATQ